MCLYMYEPSITITMIRGFSLAPVVMKTSDESILLAY